jgi:hypothetical protein
LKVPIENVGIALAENTVISIDVLGWNGVRRHYIIVIDMDTVFICRKVSMPHITPVVIGFIGEAAITYYWFQLLLECELGQQ